MTIEELEIKFRAETAGLKEQLGGIKGQLGELDKGVGKTESAFGGSFRKIGALIAGAAIGQKILSIGADAIAMANDAVESESLFEVSMGGMADSARAWSEDLSKSLGLNAYEIRKTTGVLNTMFGSMGLSEEAAFDMSKSMTMLAQDMASFYNLDPTEAFQKLQAGITGEAEPLKRLGILIDENTISQYAMANGISETGKNMTQQQKVLARYGAIVEQTSKAQGDLARTIESPTNQLRVLKSKVDEAKTALGMALQPALIAVLPVVTNLANGVAGLVGNLSGLGKDDVLGDVVISVEEASESIADAVDMGFGTAGKTIAEFEVKTTSALESLAENKKLIKKVAFEINIDPPTTTGQERITTAIDNLKSLVPVTVKTDPVIAKIDAIMRDGKVTEKEENGLSTWLNGWASKSIKAINIEAVNRTKAIDAQIKSGEIKEAEGNDLKADVEAWAREAIGSVNATVSTVKAEIGAGAESMTTVTFSPDEASKLSTLISDEITASGLTANASVSQVKATFENAGIIGVAVETLYTGLNEKVAGLNAELSAILAGWSDGLKPPTAEDWAKALEIAAERDRLIGIMSGELTTHGKLSGALSNLELNGESIANYFKAYTDAFTAESNEAAKILESQKVILQNAFGMPEFDSILKGLGLEGLSLDSALASLNQQIANALSLGKSGAVMDAANRLMPSIAEMIASGDQGQIESAMKGLTAFIDGLGGDFDTLTPEAQAAVSGMLGAFEGIGEVGIITQQAFLSAKETILLQTSGFMELFGEAGGKALGSLKQAMFHGMLTREEYDNIIGVPQSRESLQALADKYAAGGNLAVAGLIDNMIALISDAEAAGKSVSDAANAGMKGADGAGIGSNLASTFINEIKAKRGAAYSAGEALGNAAQRGMKFALAIESPSKVARKIGDYFGEGFVIGINDTAKDAIKAASGMAAGAAGALNNIPNAAIGVGRMPEGDSVAQAVSRALANVNFEMNVDGERLGRISIKAINGVIARSGRTIINLGGA